MEVFNIKNLSFTYNGKDEKALNNLSFKVNTGDFILVIGESGCGKTTLLKMLKKELTPFGKKEGEVLYNKTNIDELSPRESAFNIGYIMQDPDCQIVTDKVYSELAFGLENLGVKSDVIHKKTAEFAAYFGFSDIIERDTNSLSGGEKQLLNLASVMIMNPKVILLDEPLSMLDPIFAVEFIHTLKRINDDFGTTVIIAEHHLGEVFRLADKVLCLENGEAVAVNSPKEICRELKGKRIEDTLPVSVRIFNSFNGEGSCPLTVKECVNFIKQYKFDDCYNSDKEIKNNQEVLSVDNVFFRYEKKGKDILKNCSLSINKNSIYALLGENGCGKSTLMNVINGSFKPYRGKVKHNAKIGYIPQNPKSLFVKDSLDEDLKLVNNSYKELLDDFGLLKYEKTHPYDLSGGELQRAAICKALLNKPDILLMDEPTKGLDSFAKEKLGEMLRRLLSDGLTIIIVTHDLEFAARYADICGLLFGGGITCENLTREFFLENTFYTTPAAKIAKGTVKNAVTFKDIIKAKRN